MDTTNQSLSDWFSSTIQSVGTQAANAWADAYTTKATDPGISQPSAPPATAPAPSALGLSGLTSNPLMLVFLVGIAFVGYKLLR